MTVLDVVKFVHEQRALRGVDKVCKGWTDGQIAAAVSKAISDNTFGWVVRDNKITGFAFGFPRPNENVLDVTQVVCASPRDLAHLLLLFKRTYKNWTIRGFRHKKDSLVEYKKLDRMIHLSQLNASIYVH